MQTYKLQLDPTLCNFLAFDHLPVTDFGYKENQQRSNKPEFPLNSLLCNVGHDDCCKYNVYKDCLASAAFCHFSHLVKLL